MSQKPVGRANTEDYRRIKMVGITNLHCIYAMSIGNTVPTLVVMYLTFGT